MEIALSKLKPGDEGTIKYLEDGFEFKRKLNSMGLTEGKKIKVVSRQLLRGPIVIRIGNMEVAIGRGMADRIIIDK